MREIKYGRLEPFQKMLLDAATIVMRTAYCPYPNFSVGAALLSQSGEIITGSNVENAAYSPVICAERSALVTANARGIRTFDSIAVIAKRGDDDTTEVTAPCGHCRQMLYESAQISERNLEIIMATTRKDKIVIVTIEELLPLAFGPKDLGIDVQRYK